MLRKKTILLTRSLDLCVSCESCYAICSNNAIEMEFDNGQFLPKINEIKCKKCGLCLELCPGYDLSINLVTENKIEKKILGPILKCFTGYSKDYYTRNNSTSGGLITSLILELLKKKKYDYVFVLPFENVNNIPARLILTNNKKEIFKCAKSKYIPSSIYNIIKILKENHQSRFIIVGTACHIKGIKKIINNFNINKDNLLFLGLFCSYTLNYNFIDYIKKKYSNKEDPLVKLEYRTKDKFGWPGRPKIYLKSGKNLILERKERTSLTKYFQLNRCLYCLDKLNIEADISFGDCYIPEKESILGKSTIIIRTERGKDVFDKFSYLFNLEKEDIKNIYRSQNIKRISKRVEHLKIFLNENKSLFQKHYFKVEKENFKKYKINKKKIEWGKNKKYFMINISKFKKKIFYLLKGASNLLGQIIFIFLNGIFYYFKNKFFNYNTIPNFKKKKMSFCLIGSIGFSNKGSQALSFTSVDKLKNKYPKSEIFCFLTSMPLEFLKEKQKDIYNFNLQYWRRDFRLGILGFYKIILKNKNISKELLEAKKILKNTDAFIDISGYALSSQFGFLNSFDYLLNLIIASKYNIPYYIFPQSLGPFEYPFYVKILLFPLLKLYLTYPKIIYSREKQNQKYLEKFTKKKISYSVDIVLQNKGYNIQNILKSTYTPKMKNVKENSVGVIPNSKVFERVSKINFLQVYKKLIDYLVNAKNKHVYILMHSIKDKNICELIKKEVNYLNKVYLINEDYNAIELEAIIKGLDYIIVSRYHALVHSLKNGVPALVIGWADKYYELLLNFNQENYCFDVRNRLVIDELLGKLDNLDNNFKEQRKEILGKINNFKMINWEIL